MSDIGRPNSMVAKPGIDLLEIEGENEEETDATLLVSRSVDDDLVEGKKDVEGCNE